MPELIDSHCHLDFDAFDIDRDQVLARAANIGITDIIIPGVSIDNWPRVNSLCAAHSNLHPCYGLHPYLVSEHGKEAIKALTHWLGNHSCIAIGELGLDFRTGMADKSIQMYFFEHQLDIALETRLPAVIHSVRATNEVMNTLKKKPGLRGMIHSYSGSYEQAMQLIDNGFYISIGGPVTHPGAKKLHQVARKIPLNALLLETDAPDQPDYAHKNLRNEPAYLIKVLETVSELRGESAEDIASQTSTNARCLFNL